MNASISGRSFDSCSSGNVRSKYWIDSSSNCLVKRHIVIVKHILSSA